MEGHNLRIHKIEESAEMVEAVQAALKAKEDNVDELNAKMHDNLKQASKDDKIRELQANVAAVAACYPRTKIHPLKRERPPRPSDWLHEMVCRRR